MTKGLNKLFQVVHRNTLDEDAGYCRYRKEWEHYAATLEVSPCPLHVDIELTNACNLRCLMCERNVMKRPVGYMKLDMFRKIVDQCAESNIYSIKMNLWGESLLHKDFFKMAEYAKSKGIHIQFNTNAMLLTEEKALALAESGIDRVTISVESMKPAEYEAIRKGGDLPTLINNIERLIKLKPVGRKPYLTLQFIRMRRNNEGVNAFMDAYRDKVDFISATNISSTCGDPEVLKESMIDYSVMPKMPCPEIWLRLSVLWNGDVTVCCNDFDGFLTIGSLNDETLMGLWHGKRLAEIRARHKRLDFSGLVCDLCTINRRTA